MSDSETLVIPEPPTTTKASESKDADEPWPAMRRLAEVFPDEDVYRGCNKSSKRRMM